MATVSPRKTARFWVYWNGWVRIKLRRGQTVTLRSGGPTDEGYRYDERTYSWYGDAVTVEIESEAQDCDGPTSSSSQYYCPLDKLEEIAPEPANDYGPERPARPSWEHHHTRLRDVYAEMAGY